ncbi:MAG: multiheme c-type cytochrome [Candidatus Krumholzibacteriia bacterium]
MIRLRLTLVVLALLGILPLVTGCEDDIEPVRLPGEVTLADAYVGPQACRDCHQSVYDLFAASGHAHALSRVVDGHAPLFPYSAVTDPPAGSAWSDLQYVIGGYGWKADFVDAQGYLVTGDAAQWNLATFVFGPFEPDATSLPFTCARCHATGFSADGSQGGLPGMAGTWRQDGVNCERCHGAGGAHALSQLASDIAVDRDAGLCGECHSRGDPAHRIEAADGFILNNGQYDELLGGAHRTLTCVACHDPHATTHQAPAQGVELQCVNCHGDIEIYNTGDGAHTCINCHMPFATKSAVAEGPFRGDVRTHIFRIDPAADAAQFTTTADGTFANGYLTTDFTCLACHSGRDRAWAAQYAGTIHSVGRKTTVAGR